VPKLISKYRINHKLSEFNIIAIKGLTPLAQSKLIRSIVVSFGSQERNEVSQGNTNVDPQIPKKLKHVLKNENISLISRSDRNTIISPNDLLVTIKRIPIQFSILIDISNLCIFGNEPDKIDMLTK
jgi:hypothetical protein